MLLRPITDERDPALPTLQLISPLKWVSHVWVCIYLYIEQWGPGALLCCQQNHSPGLLLLLNLSLHNFIYSLCASLSVWLFAPFRGSCATTCSYWQAKPAKYLFLIGLRLAYRKEDSETQPYCALHHPRKMTLIAGFCKAGIVPKSTRGLCQP